MSGTSADGIDAVVVRLGWPPTLADLRDVTLHTRPFAGPEREAIFSLFDTDRTTARDVCAMNFRIGEWFAQAALGAASAAGLTPDEIDLIGSHGQTIFHQPPEPGATASSLQVGEPSVIAERTGITTVGDFRVRDMAAGGHGAPLVSYVDALLLGHPTRTRAVLNLGGIANVTVLPPARGGARPIAFDTGPANMVLDWLAATLTRGALRYDESGRLAAAGRVDGTLLNALLADPYFAAPPPKTTGRERFGAPYAHALLEQARARGLRDVDVMATALALTAESVARGIRATALTHGTVDEVIAGGGGTQNPVLMAEIARRLTGVTVRTHEAHGVSSQAKEALTFAVLAAAAVRGETNTVPSCTGATHSTVMGKIVPGR
ncbi:MAG TPA: anhydro-N-acetylmuramic acid kinase, partial [Chloroflexota bacterium]|nr:anhydro-N-acetylmuramic acid kinase [Chloroflexota bacterium]